MLAWAHYPAATGYGACAVQIQVDRERSVGLGMLWALATILWPQRFVDRLTPYDLTLRHRRHRIESASKLSSILPADEVLGTEIRSQNLEMAKVIRRSLLASASLVCAVFLIAAAVASLTDSGALLPENASGRLGALSVLVLVAATLGRVGWPRRSREDLTTLGMADRWIHWVLYGLGGLLGVLAFLA